VYRKYCESPSKMKCYIAIALALLVCIIHAEVTVEINTCNVMSVTLDTERMIHLHAEIGRLDEDEIVVLGFEQFTGDFHECDYVAKHEDTKLLSNLPLGNVLPSEHVFTFTQRVSDSSVSLTTRIPISSVVSCPGVELAANTDMGDISGQFHMSIVKMERDTESLVIMSSVWHNFLLDQDNLVSRVADMPWALSMQWVRAFETTDSQLHMEFQSTLHSDQYLLRLRDPVIIDTNGDLEEADLTITELTDCDKTTATGFLGTCEQTWFLRVNDYPGDIQGSIKLTANLEDRISSGTDDVEYIPISLEVFYNYEYLESPEVDSMMFRDGSDMSIPYASFSLESGNLVDGDYVTIMFTGTNQLRSARICTSDSTNLLSDLDCEDCGCDTQGIDDLIVETIFDIDENYNGTANDMFSPVNINSNLLGFTIRKLSEKQHVIEIDYYSSNAKEKRFWGNDDMEDEDGDDGQLRKRGHISSWDSTSNDSNGHHGHHRHDAFVDCSHGRNFHHNNHRCQFPRSAWWWVGVFIFIIFICLCCAGWLYWGSYSDGSYGYGYGGSGYTHAHKTTTTHQTQQGQSTKQAQQGPIVINKITTHSGRGHVVQVDLDDDDDSSLDIPESEVYYVTGKIPESMHQRNPNNNQE